MLTLTTSRRKGLSPASLAFGRFLLSASITTLLLHGAAQPLQAAYSLAGDPGFSFGTTPPDSVAMAAAISARLGFVVNVVNSFVNENTSFAPTVADSQMAPNYIYGPSANGVIKNLNLNSAVVTGLTSGALRSSGFDTDFCGDVVSRFVLRVNSSNQFYDVLVRADSCSGRGNVVWSFDQISAPRPLAAGGTPSPTPIPVQLTKTSSRQIHGAAGPFDVNLPFAGPPGIEDRRTTGAGGNYTIVYTFDQPLNSVSGAKVTSGIGRVHDSGIGVDSHQYIVNLVNVANMQTITVALNFVQDDAGHESDVVNARMSLLIGDVGANGNVGSGDVTSVKSQVGHPVTMANFRNDLNHDGFINSSDVQIAQNQKGSSLPLP